MPCVGAGLAYQPAASVREQHRDKKVFEPLAGKPIYAITYGGGHQKSWTALVAALTLPPEDSPVARGKYFFGALRLYLGCSFDIC